MKVNDKADPSSYLFDIVWPLMHKTKITSFLHILLWNLLFIIYRKGQYLNVFGNLVKNTHHNSKTRKIYEQSRTRKMHRMICTPDRPKSFKKLSFLFIVMLVHWSVPRYNLTTLKHLQSFFRKLGTIEIVIVAINGKLLIIYQLFVCKRSRCNQC